MKRFKIPQTLEEAQIIARYNQAREAVQNVTDTARMLGSISTFTKPDFKKWFDAELNQDGFFPDQFLIHLYLEFVCDVEPEEIELN